MSFADRMAATSGACLSSTVSATHPPKLSCHSEKVSREVLFTIFSRKRLPCREIIHARSHASRDVYAKHALVFIFTPTTDCPYSNLSLTFIGWLSILIAYLNLARCAYRCMILLGCGFL